MTKRKAPKTPPAAPELAAFVDPADANATIAAAPAPTKRMVNHVLFALDESSSMAGHARNVERVFSELLKTMQNTALGQETFISVYGFANMVRRIIFDQPASSVANVRINPNGMTALIDAANQSIRDALTQIQVDQVNEDHTFLLYVLTDGGENHSRTRPQDLANLISSLGPEWTVAVMVPDLTGVAQAKQFGFPAGNIERWNVNSERGFEDAARTMSTAYASYSNSRSLGVRSTKSLFSVNANNLTKNVVRSNLTEVNATIYQVPQEGQVRDVAELITKKPYVTGSVFYELLKKEEVNAKKEIVIVNKTDGKKYSGQNARDLLGLPYQAINVAPGDFGEWRIFVQSTSVNRKIPQGTNVLIK
jgi:hypothetical protein